MARQAAPKPIAVLPGNSAMDCVGPPLSASGPRFKPTALVMLWLLLAGLDTTTVPMTMLLLRIKGLNVNVRSIASAVGAVLPDSVLLLSVRVPKSAIAPPLIVALLPETVLLLSVKLLLVLKIAPPTPAELAERVLLLTMAMAEL